MRIQQTLIILILTGVVQEISNLRGGSDLAKAHPVLPLT